MDLAQQIRNYYFDHLSELPQDKQFHFANRLAQWDGDARAIDVVGSMKNSIAPPADQLPGLFGNLVSAEPPKNINSYSDRKPFFDKYPLLYGAHLALFRLRHLKYIYGIDAKEAFYSQVSQQRLDKLAAGLVSDKEAMKTLSTYAINFLFLYKWILGGSTRLDSDNIIRLKDSYDLKDPEQIRLLIYLFTHCIIGESNFYVRQISSGKINLYKKMLAILEDLIQEKYEQINLDNKLEFLVCARICGVDSPLFSKVEYECRQSVSDKGCFLVDKLTETDGKRASIDKSEHRNVLYIMSRSSYRPRGLISSP